MKPFQLGVTGGIGSGKSVICAVLSTLGIPVYNADDESKKLLETNPDVVVAVTSLLGKDSYLPDGKADRPFIANVVFNHPEKLQKLNSILHPAVQSHYRDWVASNTSFEIVVKEAAILFESGAYKDMNAVIAVTAPMQLRIERVIARDGKSIAEVKKIISQQLSQEEVIEKSDFEIINDDQQLVIPQILEIIHQIKSRSN